MLSGKISRIYMNLWRRFRMLTIWNKCSFLGSIASLIALAFAIFVDFLPHRTLQPIQIVNIYQLPQQPNPPERADKSDLQTELQTAMIRHEIGHWAGFADLNEPSFSRDIMEKLKSLHGE